MIFLFLKIWVMESSCSLENKNMDFVWNGEDYGAVTFGVLQAKWF